jgi:hypothetical protein
MVGAAANTSKLKARNADPNKWRTIFLMAYCLPVDLQARSALVADQSNDSIAPLH